MIEGDQHYDLNDFAVWFAADVDGTIKWFKEIGTLHGKDGKTVLFNLQEISGNVTVDLNKVSQDYLSAVIAGNTNVSFINVPEVLHLEFKTIMKTNGNTLSIAGKLLDVSYNSGDTFVWRISTLRGEAGLSASFQSIEEIENFVVSVPQNYASLVKSDQEILLSWNQPLQGNVPITYDLAYSKYYSVDADGNPNVANMIFVNDLEALDYLLSELSHSTKYYIFLRSKNIISKSVSLIYNNRQQSRDQKQGITRLYSTNSSPCITIVTDPRLYLLTDPKFQNIIYVTRKLFHETTKSAHTIVTKYIGPYPSMMISDGTYARKLTNEELATLQGFRKDFKFYGCKTSVRRQIGNALPAVISKAFFEKIRL